MGHRPDGSQSSRRGSGFLHLLPVIATYLATCLAVWTFNREAPRIAELVWGRSKLVSSATQTAAQRRPKLH